jgi:hypothetical protein
MHRLVKEIPLVGNWEDLQKRTVTGNVLIFLSRLTQSALGGFMRCPG